MSGKNIRRGDHVYRPVGEPLNKNQCICADAVYPLFEPADGKGVAVRMTNTTGKQP